MLGSTELDAVFDATDVGSIWSVGRRIGAKLREQGVTTALDFVRSDAAVIRKQFSVVLEKTLLALRGTSCLDLSDVADAPTARQQILVSRSFGKAITTPAGIVEAVSEFASRAAEKLRHQDSAAGAVGVFFTTSPFRPNDRQHSVNVTVPLIRPTADTCLLVETAVQAARREFRPGFNYAKAGVILVVPQPASQHQGELVLFVLFSSDEALAPPSKDRTALMDAMDVLNRRFGRDAVRVGSATLASHNTDVRSWATRQERRSPRFTTRWDEMPVVKA
jgi:DNA polymerase V